MNQNNKPSFTTLLTEIRNASQMYKGDPEKYKAYVKEKYQQYMNKDKQKENPQTLEFYASKSTNSNSYSLSNKAKAKGRSTVWSFSEVWRIIALIAVIDFIIFGIILSGFFK